LRTLPSSDSVDFVAPLEFHSVLRIVAIIVVAIAEERCGFLVEALGVLGIGLGAEVKDRLHDSDCRTGVWSVGQRQLGISAPAHNRTATRSFIAYLTGRGLQTTSLQVSA
jgi:hypothetical protein